MPVLIPFVFLALLYAEINKWLDRRERSNTYLNHVCKLQQSIERLENQEILEFSASTVSFIGCWLELHLSSSLQLIKTTCWLKLPTCLRFLHSVAVCRCESGRCCSFLSHLATFLVMSPFQIFFYIIIQR